MARVAMKQHEMILVNLLSGDTVTVASLKEKLPSDFNWKELYKYVARIKLRAGGVVSVTKQDKEIVALTLTNPDKFKVGQTGPRWSQAFQSYIYGDKQVPIVASKPAKAPKAPKAPKVAKPKVEKVAKPKVEKVAKPKVETKVDGSKVVDMIRQELEATKPVGQPVVKAAACKMTAKEWAEAHKDNPRSINEAPPMDPIDWDSIKWTNRGSTAVDKEFDSVDISDIVGSRTPVYD